MMIKRTLKEISLQNQELDQELPILETIALSGEDAINFLDLLENPPKPSENLKKAAIRFCENYGN